MVSRNIERYIPEEYLLEIYGTLFQALQNSISSELAIRDSLIIMLPMT
jgi:hypothetical protein